MFIPSISCREAPLSGALGCIWLSRKKWVTELLLDLTKTQAKSCVEPHYGPSMLGSKGCSSSALALHWGGGSSSPEAQSLRSP